MTDWVQIESPYVTCYQRIILTYERHTSYSFPVIADYWPNYYFWQFDSECFSLTYSFRTNL